MGARSGPHSEQGPDPDPEPGAAVKRVDDERVDEGLVSERSSHAWSRTALGWLGAGAVVIRYLGYEGPFDPHAIGGHLMLAVAVIIYFGSGLRYFQMRRSFTAQARGVPETAATIHAAPRMVFAVSATATAACLVVLIAELTRLGQ